MADRLARRRRGTEIACAVARRGSSSPVRYHRISATDEGRRGPTHRYTFHLPASNGAPCQSRVASSSSLRSEEGSRYASRRPRRLNRVRWSRTSAAFARQPSAWASPHLRSATPSVSSSSGSAFACCNVPTAVSFAAPSAHRDDVTNELLPNRFAMVAEIEETWTTPVDCRVKTIGGTVFRRAIADVNSTVEDEHIAAIKAEPLIGVNAPS